MRNEIIKEIFLVKRNCDMRGTVSESMSRAGDNETTPLLARFVPTSLQHWGILICFPEGRGYAKLIEATYDQQTGKIDCTILDWTIDVAEWWSSMPGFKMKTIPLNGKNYYFNAKNIDRFLQRFKESNMSFMSYDPILNNCQTFVQDLMSVLTLPEVFVSLPRPLNLSCSSFIYSFSTSLFLLFLIYGDREGYFRNWVICYLEEIANYDEMDALSSKMKMLLIIIFSLFSGMITLTLFLSSGNIQKKFENAIRSIILHFPSMVIRIILFLTFHALFFCCITIFALMFRDVSTPCTGKTYCRLLLDPEY